MQKILLAVDGSPSARRATQTVIRQMELLKEKPQVDVLTVHLPLPQFGTMSLASAVPMDTQEQYYKEESNAALAPTVAALKQAGVPFKEHRAVGPIAETILQTAEKLGSSSIYMGTRGNSNVTNLLIGSVTNKVLHLAKVPVVLTH